MGSSGQESKAIQSLVIALLVAVIFTGAEPAAAQESSSSEEAPIGMTLTASRDVLRPGDSFTVTVTLDNVSAGQIDDLTLEVSLPTNAIRDTSAASPLDGVVPTTSDGTTTWNDFSLPSGEELVFTATGTALASIVDLTEIMVTGRALVADSPIADDDIVVRPVVTISRTVDTPAADRTTNSSVVSVTTSITPHADLTGLVIVETLARADGGANPVPNPIRRLDDANAAQGRLEWTIPSLSDGAQTELIYEASYEHSMNTGPLQVTVSGEVRDNLGELFRQEQDIEVRIPQLNIVEFGFVDPTPDDPIKPGEQIKGSLELTNRGLPATSVTVDIDLKAEDLEASNPDHNGVADGPRLSWTVDTFSTTSTDADGLILNFDVVVPEDLRQDLRTTPSASVAIGDVVVDRSDSEEILVDTVRREGSDDSLWFSLILIFVFLGFGATVLALYLHDKMSKEMPKEVSALAGVVVIVGAILILAFGLQLESETTLTLLGTIAGYVLGREALERRDDRDKNEGQDKGSRTGESTQTQ